jgi:Protein of unknown function (DUF3833)
VLERDLVGPSTARRAFRSIFGAKRGFTAQLNGAWDGRVLTLAKNFVFDDGERDHKIWRFERTEPGRYVGTRADAVGQAQGFQDGAAVRLEYDVILKSATVAGGKVHLRDIMAFNGDGDVLNKLLWAGGDFASPRRARYPAQTQSGPPQVGGFRRNPFSLGVRRQPCGTARAS